jgi:hypothetical protein
VTRIFKELVYMGGFHVPVHENIWAVVVPSLLFCTHLFLGDRVDSWEGPSFNVHMLEA